MANVATEVLLILLLIALNGVLAMSEIAVVSARKARLRQRAHAGDARAAAALRLAEEPTRFLSTVQVGITLVGIFTGAFGGATVAEQIAAALGDVPPLAPYGEPIGLAVVVIAIAYLTLIFGELVPKRVGLSNAETIAATIARPMGLLAALGRPLVAALTASTEAVLRVLGVRPSVEGAVTEEEVKIMLAEGAEAGVFEQTERELVESVFGLADRRIGGLMTPRPLIVWLDAEDPPEVNGRKVTDGPHTYFPVCRGELDNVLGVVSLKALWRGRVDGRPLDLQVALEQPIFVPENAPVLRVLDLFRQGLPHVALVVDEHGSVAGLVTHADLLEAIVGDVAPAGGEAPAGPVRRADGSWLLDGLTPVDDLDELLGLGELPAGERDEYATLGGLVMHRLGHVPAVGERFTWRDRRFEVVDMDGRRVDKVLVAPAPAGEAGP